MRATRPLGIPPGLLVPGIVFGTPNDAVPAGFLGRLAPPFRRSA